MKGIAQGGETKHGREYNLDGDSVFRLSGCLWLVGRFRSRLGDSLESTGLQALPSDARLHAEVSPLKPVSLFSNRSRTSVWLPWVVAVQLTLLWTCTAPDQPAGRVPPLPPRALEQLAPDSLRSLRLGDGVFYRYVWSPQGPWAVHLVSADLRRCDVSLLVVPAVEADGVTRRRMSVSQMFPPLPARVLAGVNGDFFGEGGIPLGSEVTSTTQRFAGRPALAWRAGQAPWIGIPVREEPGRVRFGFEVLSMGSRPHSLQVVSGFPELLDGGRPGGYLRSEVLPSFAADRHPRTGAGFNREEGVFWLAVVDGRQAPRSVGMSLPELTDLFLALGVDDAINLDGGGSSAISLRGRLANRPSDPTGERPVGNSLWLVSDDTGCTTREGPG